MGIGHPVEGGIQGAGFVLEVAEASFTLQDAVTAGDKESFLAFAEQDLGEEKAQRRYDAIIATGIRESTPP